MAADKHTDDAGLTSCDDFAMAVPLCATAKTGKSGKFFQSRPRWGELTALKLCAYRDFRIIKIAISTEGPYMCPNL